MELPKDTQLHPGHTDPTTVGEEWESNAFVRLWRGLDDEGDEPCTVEGEEATLVLWGPDYDGGHKAWVRWPDGGDDIVPGSRVEPLIPLTDARRALLGRLIDHAALFPPASMTMEDAVAEDRAARGGAYALDGRALRLPGLAARGAARRLRRLAGAPPLSVVLDGAGPDRRGELERGARGRRRA